MTSRQLGQITVDSLLSEANLVSLVAGCGVSRIRSHLTSTVLDPDLSSIA